MGVGQAATLLQVFEKSKCYLNPELPGDEVGYLGAQWHQPHGGQCALHLPCSVKTWALIIAEALACKVE